MTDPYMNPANGRLVDPGVSSNERNWALFMHLASLFSWAIPALPALVMWQIKKNESPYLDDHGKEAVNFQISLVLYGLASTVLTAIGIGVLLWMAVFVLWVVGLVMGSTAASRGEYFRYPACIRIIR